MSTAKQQKNPYKKRFFQIFTSAEDRTRTCTLIVPAPKAGASTNSATSARLGLL